MQLKIRRMEQRDLDEVLAIEEMSFRCPWSKKSFEKELKKAFSEPSVAVIDACVVGYSIVWVGVDGIHIANLAVRSDWRRCGIGAMLLEAILANREGFSWVGLEVRRSNAEARLLYKKYGFREIGYRENYYSLENQDAVVMVKPLLCEVNEGKENGLV